MLRRGLQALYRCSTGHLSQQQASSASSTSPLCRGLHTSNVAAADGSGSSVLSFPSWLSTGALRVSTPLTEALPGVDPDPGFKGPKDPPPTLVTTLENGVRIVSEASLVSVERERVILLCGMALRQTMRVHVPCHLNTQQQPQQKVPKAAESTHAQHPSNFNSTPLCACFVLVCVVSAFVRGVFVQGPTASMGLYVDSGSIYESQHSTGDGDDKHR